MSRHPTVRAGCRAAAAVLAVSGIAACTGESADDAGRAVEKLPQQAQRQLERAAALFDDATVTAKVKTALLAAPHLKGLAIDVDTSQNIVSLSGTVATEEARADAERVARQVEGVREVKNNLQVKKAT